VLAGWTAYWHWRWLQSEPSMHGLAAFFLGLLLLILGQAVVRLAAGAFKHGWRWMFSRQAFRLCGWSALFAVSTVVLFYNVERWRGKRAWARLVVDAERQGETLDLNRMVPPPVPENQDFAQAPCFAPMLTALTNGPDAASKPGDSGELAWVSSVSTLERWQSLCVTNLKFAPWLNQEWTDFRPWLHSLRGGENNLPAKNSPSPAGAEELRSIPRPVPDLEPAKAADQILASLKPFDETIDQLRDYSSRPYCRFPVDWGRQFLGENSGLRLLGGVARIVRVRASAELAMGQTDAAFQDTQLALRLGDYARQQPSMWASWRRLRVVVDAIQPVWEGLASRQWNDQQVRALQSQLAGFDLLADYPAVIRVESFGLAAILESVIPTAHHSQRVPVHSERRERDDGKEWSLRLLFGMYPTGWSLQDQAAIHRECLRKVAAFSDPATPRALRVEPSRLEILRDSSDPFFPVFVVPKVREVLGSAGSFCFAQSAVDEAVLACALERHRLATGQYPETLEALVPRFVAKLPHDVVNGQPLKYRRLDADRFLLYSVGLNRTDDGGRANSGGLDWQRWPDRMPYLLEGDWVWAYPVR